jgi:hypothetical protein
MKMEYVPPDDGDRGIGADMSDDDQRILRLWRQALSVLDARYEDKRLVRIAAQAMVDDELRAKVAQGDYVAEGEQSAPGEGEAEAGAVEVRFHVNTPETLHVVLPPRAGEIETQPVALRNDLRSRTASSDRGWFQDDFDISDTGGADPPINLPLGDGVDSVGAPTGGDTPLPPI